MQTNTYKSGQLIDTMSRRSPFNDKHRVYFKDQKNVVEVYKEQNTVDSISSVLKSAATNQNFRLIIKLAALIRQEKKKQQIKVTRQQTSSHPMVRGTKLAVKSRLQSLLVTNKHEINRMLKGRIQESSQITARNFLP